MFPCLNMRLTWDAKWGFPLTINSVSTWSCFLMGPWFLYGKVSPYQQSVAIKWMVKHSQSILIITPWVGEWQPFAGYTENLRFIKIFVGGLSPSVGSDDLKDCFEAEFGPVEEAIFMSTQTGGHIQSRGFGFVTFVKEASCIAAVRQHYLIIYGKRVEIKAALQPPKRANEDMLDIHS
ncbi:hypothetical protein GOP47_0003893 [Adiantum capillus-veneris]|uniref:RRM domain-containing protein n=1 Tax=Adiantum capillus-veneris TaxID=13818 RepID=A0A9D4ZPV2_ADICA|nr:hypothetical protein GOP47_0003893 [Adiantum capillus-veneris]